MLGHSNAEVRIYAGPIGKTLSAKGETSLGKHIPKGFEGELRIEVVPGGGRHRFFALYCGTLPEFRRDEIDGKIWHLQQAFCEHPAAPDLKQWRGSCGVASKSSTLEDRYVNGFFEYTLGFALEQGGDTKEAKAHFEDAFGYLFPFRTLLAEQAQGVLGLKMNCFAILERCAEDSFFGPARAFFARHPEAWNQPKKWPARDSFGVYADEFTMRLARVVALFYTEDDALFWQGVEALKFHPAGQEKNNSDKLQLLQARAFLRRGDRAKAREFYRLLRYNPQFGVEAEEFLKDE